MTAPPKAAIILTALGILPFVFGAAIDPITDVHKFSPGVNGTTVLLDYGKIILSFMGGCLWGFGAKSEPGQTRWYVLSVAPALWAFLVVGTNLWLLALGFALLLAADYLFQIRALAPKWWMTLRIPVSVTVIICLILGAIK